MTKRRLPSKSEASDQDLSQQFGSVHAVMFDIQLDRPRRGGISIRSTTFGGIRRGCVSVDRTLKLRRKYCLFTIKKLLRLCFNGTLRFRHLTEIEMAD
jgi:hypothetical protein